MLRAILLSTALLVLNGCNANSEAGAHPAGAPAQSGEVSIRDVARGGQSGLRKPRQIVIRSAAEWDALWKEHAAERLPAEPAPTIDFTKETVVGVALGDRPTAGYGVQITRVQRESDRLSVRTLETTPASDTMQATVVTSPFDFVAVPRFEGEIVFAAD